MMIPSNKVAVIITAAGSSTRMGGSIKKEYLPIRNETVLSSCVNAFLKTFETLKNQFEITHLVITVPENGKNDAEKAVLPFVKSDIFDCSKIVFTEGGATRQESVFNALISIKISTVEPQIVLIHDGARPFVSDKVISDVCFAARDFDASVPGITPTDTIKEIDENGFIKTHLVRKNLVAVQTPQGFNFPRLFEAHKKAAEDDREYTDDTEIWQKYNSAVKTVAGDVRNIKITYPGDLEKGVCL